MADAPLAFDASNLDGLAKIKAEQQSLRDLATRAAEHREKVTEVYNRVVRDYEARIRALDDQARRLGAQLGEEFARLDASYGEARRALDQARFDLQESEFRKEIGEFSGEEFERRQRTIEASIAEKQRDLERIGQLRSRYLDLLPVEASAPVGVGTQPPPAAPTLPPVPEAAQPPVVPLPTPRPIVPSPSTLAASAAAPVPPAGAAAPPAGAASAPLSKPPASPATQPGTWEPAMAGIGETMVQAPPGSAVFRMPPLPPAADDSSTQILTPPVAGGPVEAPEAFATVAIPVGALIEEKSGAAPVTHRLGVLTTIGRTPDNQIVIPSREVSRKHAEVVLGQGGYLLRDLGSPNGTFLNGKKITEQPLREGDRITVAGQTFVFKAK